MSVLCVSDFLYIKYRQVFLVKCHIHIKFARLAGSHKEAY